MYPAPRICPVCQDELAIAKLECRNCGTAVQGTFSFSGLAQLSGEQLVFVETFIRCEGKLNRMEKEFGLSYPTLRARLREIIKALGFSPEEAGKEIISDEERARILDEIAQGRLTADEAMTLLEA